MGERAVCARCGDMKRGHDQVCSGCGHRPSGEGLLVAWLLSENHVPPARLAELADRVRRGEAIRPSERMLHVARAALHRQLHSDDGLGLRRGAGLLAVSILLTPLPAYVLALWWRREHPRSAVQAGLVGGAATCLAGVVSASWLFS